MKKKEIILHRQIDDSSVNSHMCHCEEEQSSDAAIQKTNFSAFQPFSFSSKVAFSLAELMVVMLILTIILAATMPILSKRAKVKVAGAASSTSNYVTCTKVVNSKLDTTLIGDIKTLSYVMYGGGGGGGANYPYQIYGYGFQYNTLAGGGGGGSSAIIVDGVIIDSAAGGIGGAGNANGADGAMVQKNLTVNLTKGQKLTVYAGGGGGGAGVNADYNGPSSMVYGPSTCLIFPLTGGGGSGWYGGGGGGVQAGYISSTPNTGSGGVGSGVSYMRVSGNYSIIATGTIKNIGGGGGLINAGGAAGVSDSQSSGAGTSFMGGNGTALGGNGALAVTNSFAAYSFTWAGNASYAQVLSGNGGGYGGTGGNGGACVIGLGDCPISKINATAADSPPGTGKGGTGGTYSDPGTRTNSRGGAGGSVTLTYTAPFCFLDNI